MLPIHTLPMPPVKTQPYPLDGEPLTQERQSPRPTRYSALRNALILLGLGLAFLMLPASVPPLGAEPPVGVEHERVDLASQPRAPQSPAEQLPPVVIPPADEGSTGVRYRIAVDQEGLYAVTGAALEAAGLNLGLVSTSTLVLTSQGLPIAFQAVGLEDGAFDLDDSLLFYGLPLTDTTATKYTQTNIYWLHLTQTAPTTHMLTRSAAPAGAPPAPNSFTTTLRLELQRMWWSLNTTTPMGRDTFFWQRVTAAGSRYTATFTAEIPDPAPESYPAHLYAEVYGRANTPMQAEMYWSAAAITPAATGAWTGAVRATLTGTLPSTLLTPGLNTVRYVGVIDANHTLHDAYFDFFELTYRRRYHAQNDQLLFRVAADGPALVSITGFSSPAVRLYDITVPHSPTLLTDAVLAGTGPYTLTAQLAGGDARRYLAVGLAALATPGSITQVVPTGLRAASNRADYLIVTHADFLTAAQHLADFREAHDGFRTRVVVVDDLYAEFNHGIFHPEAIRRFVAYALTNWTPPAPQYLLLMGDGNWNFPRSSLYTLEPTYIPPYLYFADPYQGEIASDNAFGAVLNNDWLPELSIGRFPVKSVTEATTMVSKTISYEQQLDGPAQTWQRRVLFVADNADPTGNYPFELQNVIDTYLPTTTLPLTLFLGVNISTSTQMRSQIAQAVNEGVGIVEYQGHGALDRWAHESIWTVNDTALLTNSQRLPVFISLNCLDGYWIYPGQTSLAESLTLHPGGGAVANWSPAGLGTVGAEGYLQAGLLPAIYATGPTPRLGPVTIAARQALAAVAPTNELLASMTLVGDPALRLTRPRCPLDLIEDGSVDVLDIQAIANQWSTQAHLSGWIPRYDLDQSGDITVVDILRVSSGWGHNCWELTSL